MDAAGNESPKTAPASATTPVGPVTGAPLPLGVFVDYAGTTTLHSHTDNFDLDTSHTTPANILGRIAERYLQGLATRARDDLGSHENYKTNGVFDLTRWKAKMQEFTEPIRTAVANAVEAGVVLGASALDEPNHASWGPVGTFNKAKVDALATYIKGIFPTLPVGYGIGPQGYLWLPNERYHVIDYIYNQYNWYIAPAGKPVWRDNVLAQAELDGVNVVFGLNILDGGIHVFDGGWTCPSATTGGQGNDAPACAMTAAQVEEWGSILGVAGLGLSMWVTAVGGTDKAPTLHWHVDAALRRQLETDPARSTRAVHRSTQLEHGPDCACLPRPVERRGDVPQGEERRGGAVGAVASVGRWIVTSAHLRYRRRTDAGESGQDRARNGPFGAQNDGEPGRNPRDVGAYNNR